MPKKTGSDVVATLKDIRCCLCCHPPVCGMDLPLTLLRFCRVPPRPGRAWKGKQEARGGAKTRQATPSKTKRLLKFLSSQGPCQKKVIRVEAFLAALTIRAEMFCAVLTEFNALWAMENLPTEAAVVEPLKKKPRSSHNGIADLFD